MFSPYYAWSRAQTPIDHTAVNVALYSPGRYRWAMTERRRTALSRSAMDLAVGPSRLAWSGSGLTIDIDEISVPLPRRLRGRVRIIPEVLNAQAWALDAAGNHVWWPIAPRARVEVEFSAPGLSWTGTGYLDSNFGCERLEHGFRRWDWSRSELGDGAAVLYDGERRDGSRFSLALRFPHDGAPERFDPPSPVDLGATPLWRMPRATSADKGAARIIRTLEDTPFYARSVVETALLGRLSTGIHESLSLDRFSLPIVQAMLPFRMPRTLR